MLKLIDTSLWIDFTRPASPQRLRDFVFTYIVAPQACVAEPVVFEATRYASARELEQMRAVFGEMLLLPAPQDLWQRAATLGQTCRSRGITVGAMDLLIATVAMYHGAELITFESDFVQIATVSSLAVHRLERLW